MKEWKIYRIENKENMFGVNQFWGVCFFVVVGILDNTESERERGSCLGEILTLSGNDEDDASPKKQFAPEPRW